MERHTRYDKDRSPEPAAEPQRLGYILEQEEVVGPLPPEEERRGQQAVTRDFESEVLGLRAEVAELKAGAEEGDDARLRLMEVLHELNQTEADMYEARRHQSGS